MGHMRSAALTCLVAAASALVGLPVMGGEPARARAASPNLTISQVEVLNREALAPWWDALEQRETRRADAVLIGTSTFEGVGAGSWGDRLPVALQSELRRRYPIDGEQAAGWLPAATFAGQDVPGLATSTPAPGVSSAFGLGRKSLFVTDASHATLTFTGSRVRVWYGWSDDGQTADGQVVLDGGPAGTLGPDGSPGSGQFWDSGPLVRGTHEITVRGTEPFLPRHVEAFEVFGSAADRTAGVHVYDGSHGGLTSAAFTPGSTVQAERAWQVVDAISPTLTVINLGSNDTAFDVPADTLRTRVEAMIARAATSAEGRDHAVLLVLPFMSVRDDPEHAPRLAGYRNTLRTLAGGNVAVVDLDAYWPTLQAGRGHETGVMLEDDFPTHPNALGHRLLLEIVSSALALSLIHI